MCGILGWVAFGRDLRRERDTLSTLTATLRHRGPDAAGMWSDRDVAIGHTRLAVVDVAGGQQPMRQETPDGMITLTYSGEVYNYRTLRTELRGAGHEFATNSDTEVVLRGYLEWGSGVIHRLRGMYAFAIWDGRTRKLLLVRDRLGVKPLYYYRVGTGIVFASEAKAVLAHPSVRRCVDVDGVRQMLGYVLALPGTVWSGLCEVAPGSMLTVAGDGIRAHRYWRLPDGYRSDEVPDAVTEVRSLLEEVVADQLAADVPVGILLSGGLDSSTLAALAARYRARAPVRTFSVELTSAVFEPNFERAAPDGLFVRQMVRALASDHVEVRFDHSQVNSLAARRRAVASYDIPPGFGDRDRSMLLFFEQVRRTVTVALSGESADELFGGYSWFFDDVATGAEMFPWVAACRPTYGIEPAALRPELWSALDFDSYLRERYRAAVAEIESRADNTPHERRMRNACALHLLHLLPVLLDRTDRLSMASGLEVRVPYADHRLIEAVYAMPWALKAIDGREKSLLRAAARPLLPAAVLDRVKTAYPVLNGSRGELLQQARDVAGQPDHPVFEIVARPWLSAVITEPVSANRANTLEWVLNLAVWLEQHEPQLSV